jgi:tetratricopeptide (TPR) repeat protein/TolB-like protein
VKVARGAHQQVVIPGIDRRDVPNQIPDVRADTELVDFADINRDAHGDSHYNHGVLRRISIYVACVAFITIALVHPPAAHADSSTVLVFPFENLTGDRSLDWIGEGISELIISRLQTEQEIYVFSRDDRVAAYEKISIPETAMVSRAMALKLGWENGSDNVITGSFSGTADDFHVRARLIDMEASAASEIPISGKLQDVIPLTTTLAWHLLKEIVPGTVSPESDYTARPPTPRSAFENYVRALHNQDLQKRIDLLQTAIRLHPQYDPALFQLGRTYHLQRDFMMSNQWLQKLPGSAPERPQVLFMMGLNYFYLGDYTRAIAIFQQLPQTYDVLLNVGAAFLRKDDATSATSAWTRAAIMDPLAGDAFFNLGYASFLKGDWSPAEKHLMTSLRLRGRDSEALFLLGRTYEKQGRAEEGRTLIAQAARLSPRVERWLKLPLPQLERFTTATTFRSHDDIWTDRRLARRVRSQDLLSWLDSIQAEIDSYLFGDALRELRDAMKIFPDSSEARSLVDEINRQRNLR